MNIMNKLRRNYLAWFLGANLLVFGCDPREHKTEYSEMLNEDAKVTKKVYTPSRHDTVIRPTIDFDGNIGISIDTDEIPEKYAVIFNCQHGEFIIQGKQERYKSLYERLEEGDDVDVLYREVYRVVYDRSKAEKELLEKRLLKYDFIDAELKNRKLRVEKEN